MMLSLIGEIKMYILIYTIYSYNPVNDTMFSDNNINVDDAVDNNDEMIKIHTSFIS